MPNIHPQYQGLQPAIPFERSVAASSSRTRSETPIHPPQIPTRSQQQSQQDQQQQAQELAQQVQQLQSPEDYNWAQSTGPPRPLVPTFHRIAPGQKARSRQQIQLDAQLERETDEELQPSQFRDQERQRLIEQENQRLRVIEQQSQYQKQHPIVPKPRTRKKPNQVQQPPQTLQQVQSQAQYQIQAQPIQIDDDDDEEENGNGAGNVQGTGDTHAEGYETLEEDEGPWIAPLIQPITPLKLPAVRPTILLGPYDDRETCMNTVQEYAVKQGYVLVQTGCARAKSRGGKYEHDNSVVRVDLQCDRGGICKNIGKGIRRRPTHKLGCPARIKLVCRKRDADKWFIDIRCEEHNHDLDPNNMDKIAAYRRWRRVQSGGKPMETHRERYSRLKKPKEDPPTPEPQFHQHGAAPATPTTPIHLAALKGQRKILEILLDNGADVNTIDATGRTPLHCAVEGKRMDCVTLLVDRGADVTILDGKGVSSLHMAVEKGMEDAVVLFIEKGADPNRLAFYLTPEILSLCKSFNRGRRVNQYGGRRS